MKKHLLINSHDRFFKTGKIGRCRLCGATIQWGKTKNKKWIPLTSKGVPHKPYCQVINIAIREADRLERIERREELTALRRAREAGL